MAQNAVERVMSRQALPPPSPIDPTTLAMVDAMLDKRSDPALSARLSDPARTSENAARESEQRANDWPLLSRYRDANAAIIDAPDMVMIGDSLTEIWAHAMPDLFDGRVLGRGIAGQTSAQILLRFYADVVALRPARVHLLCGTNDIAGNTGPTLPEDYQRNIMAMADLAAANGVEMLVASLTPATSIFWSPNAQPRVWIPHLNRWLRDFADKRGLRFIDYHPVLADEHGGLREAYSADGVHVTRAAYRAMREVLERSLAIPPSGRTA
jgi:lysophospholipase L1-like esterase